jgi:hypothetical protein
MAGRVKNCNIKNGILRLNVNFSRYFGVLEL